MTLPSQQHLTELARSFHTKKHLGQHFLVDTDALRDIVAAAKLKANDRVLEIGPGAGFLTRFLIDTGASVVGVELDAEAITELDKLKAANLQVVHGDFLRYDIGQALDKSDELTVVGNVPYQITAPIIAHLFGEIGQPSPWLKKIKSVVLTVQLEVAERFVSSPGGKDYSQVTLLVNYFANATMVRKIGKESFYPAPNVNSAVVRFELLDKPPIDCQNTKLLRQVIKAGFSQRRKMLKNTLAFMQLPPNVLDDVFSKLSLDPQARAERLSLKQFAALSDALEKAKQEN